MGGKPLLALNIVCYPNCLPLNILTAILRGGADKAIEAGAIIAGGHTIEDDEPKYGLSVTGIIHPEKIITNASAREGDLIVLTKPLGTGIINTAIKGGLAPEDVVDTAIKSMAELNNRIADMSEAGINACTDITGFGLLGHAVEMAEASGVSIELNAESIPLLPGTIEMARMGMIPAGAYNNQEYLKDKVCFKSNISSELALTFFDPQTSGGLFISIPEDCINKLTGTVKSINEDTAFQISVVGKVAKRGNHIINIV